MKITLRLMLIAAFLLVPALSGWALNDWTVLIYMVSDDDKMDLQEANLKNVRDMTLSGPPAGCDVLVIEDKSKKPGGSFISNLFSFLGKKDDVDSGASIFSIKKNDVIVEKKLGEANMGSPYVLWDFLKFAAEKHPAKRYSLIFNSHGSGIFSWRGTGGTSSPKPGAVDFNPERFVAYDETDNDCLTVFEITAVLKAFREKLNSGRKIDLMAFDACLPGSIEAMYQFRESCEVMVGSADTTSITGFPYGRIIRQLGGAVPTTPAQFAQAMSQAGLSRMGFWNLTRAQELVFSFNNLVLEVEKARKEVGTGFKFKPSQEYGSKARYWDLGDLLENLSSPPQCKNAAVIKQMAGEVREALKSCGVVGDRIAAVSIAWPTAEEYKKFHAFYKALDFAQATKWDEYLDFDLGVK